MPVSKNKSYVDYYFKRINSIQLTKLDSVTKRIQRDITISQVRVLFDGLVADYPDKKHHLDRNANIIYPFKDIRKRHCQTGGDFLLSAEKKEILTSFQENSDDEEVEATELDTDYAENLLAAKLKRNLTIWTGYQWLPEPKRVLVGPGWYLTSTDQNDSGSCRGRPVFFP